MQIFKWVIHSIYSPILTTEAKPEVILTIVLIFKACIRRKTIVGNFMEVFGRRKKT